MLVFAIKKVCSNETFVFKKPGNRKKYTQRQVEMIPRICNGLTNKEIAKQIGLTEWGVEKQRKKIYSIAGTKNGVEFFKYAFQEGLNYLGGMVKKYK